MRVAALTYPAFFISWGGFEWKRTIVPLVQLILFGMGMTLTFEDFRRVLEMPKAVFIGFGLQYTVMPVLGFSFARLFGLEGEVAAGLVLIGSCPGGVASNVMAFLARANVPLSVTMTACSTLLSPLMTPLAMKLLAGRYVPIAALPMMGSILKMVILPLVVGILVHRYLPRLAVRLVKILPLLAMLSIALIIAITIALSRDDLLRVGLALFGAAACHNTAGYLLGFHTARMLRLSGRDCRTVALEVGMQNGGMATGLAFDVLQSARAAMGSATFGPWSAITASVLASWWRKKAAAESARNRKRKAMDRKRLSGMIPPIVVPFDAAGELDEAALRSEIKYLCGTGIDGISSGGSTGEGALLSDAELLRCLEVIGEENVSRIPVYAGIIRNLTRNVIPCRTGGQSGRGGRPAGDAGILSRSDRRGEFRVFCEISEAVKLPVIIYNVVPTNILNPALFYRLVELEWIWESNRSIPSKWRKWPVRATTTSIALATRCFTAPMSPAPAARSRP